MIAETLPEVCYEGSGWGCGVGAPRGTPAEIIDKLNKSINARIISDPALKGRFVALGALPETMTPSQSAR